MNHQISRRETLAALAFIGTATAAPVVAAVQVSEKTAIDRAAWDRAFALCAEAKKELETFDAIHSRIMDQCVSSEAKVPHVTLRPDPYTGRLSRVSTEDRRYVGSARRVLEDLDAGRRKHDPIPSLQEHTQLLRDIVAADDKRNADLKAIRDQFGMDEADDRLDTLANRFSYAQSALMAMPAPDRAALNWKLQHLLEVDHGSTGGWAAEYVAQTMADARLLSDGRA